MKMSPKPLAVLLASVFMFAQPVQAAVFKVATLVPENSAWMKEMRASAEIVKERTEGRVTIKYYGGGVMGNDKKVLRKMRIGQLQGGAFTSSGLVERYPEIGLYGLPMVFRSQAEVDYVRERMDQIFIDGLEETGLVVMGFAGGGFARIMSNAPVEEFSDLSGKKIWIPEGDQLGYEAMASINLAPVVLPISDVLTGLQTGLVDVIATPPVGALVLQWYTKVDYVTDMPLAYTLGVLALDKKAFGKLSAEDQAVVQEVLQASYERLDELNRTDNESALGALRDTGIEFIVPSEPATDVWRENVLSSNLAMGEQGMFSTELLDTMLAFIEEYRSSAGLTAAAGHDTP